MKCKHCDKAFTCGCQKTQASNGATVHKTCVKEYNAKIEKTLVKNKK